MTIEEQRLSELLHRVTPEPPHLVTVEDVAIKLANNNAPARRAGRGATGVSGEDGFRGGGRFGGGGRSGGGSRRGRLTPLLAAAAVIVVAGASTGVAVALSSHSSKTPPLAGGGAASPASQSATAPASPALSATNRPSSGPVASGAPITNGAWGSSVVAPVTLTAGTLTAAGNSLYAFSSSNLLEIDPATGQTLHEAPSDGFPGQAPVLAGNKVWEVTSYGGGTVKLSGYNPGTLAADGTITVPTSGLPSGNPESILTAGPNGNLYVGAGNAVVEVAPSTGSVIRQFTLTGAAGSVAVSPDGSRVYAVVGNKLEELNASSGAVAASTTAGAQEAGELVATNGGVWYTTSGGLAGRVWFAPAGNLSSAMAIAGPSVGGDQAVPTYSGGAVWVGGTKKLECLNPDTGQVRAASLVPSDDQVPEGIGDAVSAGGHVFALYVNNRTEQGGVAVLHPPAACTAGGSPSGGTGS
ncbi:MAG TPA: PQQ-binding-like beta-propeller repeat protein [Streptosporangiaceae bacterium]